MRRRATAAVSGLRRRLTPGQAGAPSVPIFFNLLPDAEPWPKAGRVGEQRLMLVQYWRQMQQEMTPEASTAPVADAAPIDGVPVAVQAAMEAVETPAAIRANHIPPIESFDDEPDDEPVVDRPATGAIFLRPALVAAVSEVEAAPAASAEATVETPFIVAEAAPRPNWVPASVLFGTSTAPAQAESARSVATDDAAPAASLLRDDVSPVVIEPVVVEPVVVEPVVTEPAIVEPIFAEPVVAEPVLVEDVADIAAVEPATVEAVATDEAEPERESGIADVVVEMPALVAEDLGEPAFAALADQPVLELPETLFADEAAEAFVAESAAPAVAYDFAPPVVSDLVVEAAADLAPVAMSGYSETESFDFSADAFIQTVEPEHHVAASAVSETIEDDPFGGELSVEDFAAPVFAAPIEPVAVEPLAAEEPAVGEPIDLEPVGFEPVEAVEAVEPGFLPEPELSEAIVEENVTVEMPALLSVAVPQAESLAEPVDLEPVVTEVDLEPVDLEPVEAIEPGFLPEPERSEAIVEEHVSVEMPALVSKAVPQAEAESVTELVDDAPPAEVAEVEMPAFAAEAAVPEWYAAAAPVASPASFEAELAAMDDAAELFAAGIEGTDTAFAALTASAVEPARAFDLSDGGRDVADLPDLPAPVADPVWNDAMTEWTISARDIRLRRSGVIPMPTSRPARRSSVPALEKFLRAARARRARVAAESVA
ncbi:MAG TPA: hypothetical protein VMM93_09715 [Vicinamibacterales bacterium]|nr:hypothetical protein [Vicinamibacterales bacterium]